MHKGAGNFIQKWNSIARVSCSEFTGRQRLASYQYFTNRFSTYEHWILRNNMFTLNLKDRLSPRIDLSPRTINFYSGIPIPFMSPPLPYMILLVLLFVLNSVKKYMIQLAIQSHFYSIMTGTRWLVQSPKISMIILWPHHWPSVLVNKLINSILIVLVQFIVVHTSHAQLRCNDLFISRQHVIVGYPSALAELNSKSPHTIKNISEYLQSNLGIRTLEKIARGETFVIIEGDGSQRLVVFLDPHDQFIVERLIGARASFVHVFEAVTATVCD